MDTSIVHEYIIIIDTNILHATNSNFNAIECPNLNNILKLEKNYDKVLTNGMIICIPEMVLRERCEIQSNRLKVIKDGAIKYLRDLQFDDLNIQFKKEMKNYHEKIVETSENYIKTQKIYKIPICSEEYFNIIIEKAIKKEPPFKPRKNKENELEGDNGFKDAVIWYSLLEYFKKYPFPANRKIIFLTNNTKDFNKNIDKLSKEFNELTNKDIRILQYNDKKDEFTEALRNDYSESKISTFHIDYINLNGKILLLSAELETINDIALSVKDVFETDVYDSSNYEEKIKTELKTIFKKQIKEDPEFTFEEQELAHVYVSIEYYKWSYRVLSINVEFTNGTEIEDYDSTIGDGREYGEIETEEGHNYLIDDVKDYLKSKGFDLTNTDIDWAVDEITEDD